MSASVLYDEPGPKAKRLSLLLSVVFALGFAGLIGWTVYQLWLGGAFYVDRWERIADPVTWTGNRGLLVGLRNTLVTAGLGAVLAIIVGLVFAIGRSAPSRWVRIPTTIVLEFFRGMPVLLMILFVLLALSVEAFWAVVIALGIYNGAIIGEALRSGMANLPKGQRESGLAIGLTRMQTMFAIELPQSIRTMLPIIIAQLVVLLKDTALGYIVSSPELIKFGRDLANFYGAGQYALSMFFVMFAMYLALNIALTQLANYVARRMQRPRKGGKNLDGTKTQAVQLPTQALRLREEGDGKV